MKSYLVFQQLKSILKLRKNTPVAQISIQHSMQEQHEGNQKTAKQRKQDYISYGFMALSCVAWVSGYVYCNENDIGPIQLTLLRGTVLVIVNYLLCKYKKLKIDFRQDNWLTIILRNVAFMAQGMMLAFSQFYIPLYAVHTLSSTGALFVLVLDYIFDGKKISKQKGLGLAITLIGAALVVNRSYLNKILYGQPQSNQSQFKNYQSTNPLVITGVSIALFLGMIVWSFGVRISKDLKATPEQLNLSFGFVLTVFSSIAYFYIPQRHSAIIMYPGFILTGIVLTIAQFCFLQSIKFSHHLGITMVFGNVTILMGYIYSVFRYSQQLSFIAILASLLTIFGMSKIMLS